MRRQSSRGVQRVNEGSPARRASIFEGGGRRRATPNRRSASATSLEGSPARRASIFEGGGRRRATVRGRSSVDHAQAGVVMPTERRSVFWLTESRPIQK